MTDVDAIRWMASEHDLEFVDLENYGIDPAAGEILPVELARRHHMVAIKRKFGAPVIATADPDDLSAQDSVRASIGRDFISVVASPEQIEGYIDRLFGPEMPDTEDLSPDVIDTGPEAPEGLEGPDGPEGPEQQGPGLGALAIAPLPEVAEVLGDVDAAQASGTADQVEEFVPVEPAESVAQHTPIEVDGQIEEVDGGSVHEDLPAVTDVDGGDPGAPADLDADGGGLTDLDSDTVASTEFVEPAVAELDGGEPVAEEIVAEEPVAEEPPPAATGKGRRGKEDRKRRKSSVEAHSAVLDTTADLGTTGDLDAAEWREIAVDAPPVESPTVGGWIDPGTDTAEEVEIAGELSYPGEPAFAPAGDHPAPAVDDLIGEGLQESAERIHRRARVRDARAGYEHPPVVRIRLDGPGSDQCRQPVGRQRGSTRRA